MKGESPLPSDGLGRLLEGLLAVSRLMRHGLVIMECFQRLVWVFGLGSGWRPSELYAFDVERTNQIVARGGMMLPEHAGC